MSTPSTNLPVVIGGKQFQFADDVKKVLLTRTVSGWSTEEVATLGESDVFVIRNNEGDLRLVKKMVRLSLEKKEIAPVGNGNHMVSISGYATCNRIAGLHQITPPSILIGGQEKENPYAMHNPVTGEIRRWVCRKIAIGYSPLGNLVAIDAVRYYDFEAYYLQDLQAKASKHPDAVRFGVKFACPMTPGVETKERDGVTYTQTEKGIYVFKPIKDAEGLWININSSEVADVYKQHIAHQKFGDVIAQTMTWRNAMKAHPAIAATQVTVVNGFADVMVYGFKSELTRAKLEEVGEQVAKGMEVTGVQVTQVTEEASYEEVATERDTIIAAETAEEGGSSEPQPQEKKDDPNLKAKIEALAKEKGIPDLEAFCRNSMGKPFAELSPEQLTKLTTILEKASAAKKGGVK